jgi:hypothetical protein
VKLAWSDVVRDVNDGPVVIKHYEIWRGDNQGSPVEFLETVSIDAEPSESGFEWYNPISWRTGMEYTYQVRAVDRADAAGQLSPKHER